MTCEDPYGCCCCFCAFGFFIPGAVGMMLFTALIGLIIFLAGGSVIVYVIPFVWVGISAMGLTYFLFQNWMWSQKSNPNREHWRRLPNSLHVIPPPNTNAEINDHTQDLINAMMGTEDEDDDDKKNN